MRLGRLRSSVPALLLAVAGWAAGCATAPQPMVDPGFGSGMYAPARVTVLPPDVFVILDQAGDDDPAASAALGQQVSQEMGRALENALRARGYDVDFSARRDGVYGRDGTLLVSADEIGGLANGVLAFANSPDGGGSGPMPQPRVVTPELASRIGGATGTDAFLYVNVKGAVTTPGKRAASVTAAVFIVFIIIAIIAIAIASSKSGGGGGGGSSPVVGGGGWRGQTVGRAAAPAGGAGWRGVAGGAAAGSAWRGVPGGGASRAVAAPVPVGGGGGWGGRGAPPPVPRGAPVYRGGGPRVGIGIGVMVPLNGPVHTHDGSVGYEDPLFAGDELYASMTLVSTTDGRVLWHARQNLDLEANHPEDIDRLVQTFLSTLPARWGPSKGPQTPPR